MIVLSSPVSLNILRSEDRIRSAARLNEYPASRSRKEAPCRVSGLMFITRIVEVGSQHSNLVLVYSSQNGYWLTKMRKVLHPHLRRWDRQFAASRVS